MLAALSGLILLAPRAANGSNAAQSNLERRFHDTVHPFLETYCFQCHAKDKPKGDFDMRPFTSVEAVTKDERRWKMVLDQLAEEQMPPEEAKRHPEPKQRQQILAWIKDLRSFEGKRDAGDPGIVLARRLSNAEYDNTIRDLTGVDIRPAKEFPVDPANEAGFDNSGESLTMSPSLLKKQLEAGRYVAEHLLLKPEGFTFAPFPVITDTDRDKYCVRQIIEFYRRQPTNYVDYFMAAWRFKNRAALKRSHATLAEIAAAADLSPKYLATIWATLNAPDEELGPIAALQVLWRTLPAPDRGQMDEVRRGCEKMRDLASRLRDTAKVKVGNLRARSMNEGSQTLVLWKDRQMAANRRTYGGGALSLNPAKFAEGAAAAVLTPPTEPAARERFEAAFKRFCSVFPDAFYISERGRVFLDEGEDPGNTGRLLSAGFHNQMGYFRDDQPLSDLILSDQGRHELDDLWREFEFASDLPARMHSGFIWYERAEAGYLRGPEFDFVRAEDKDITAPAKFHKFADLYLAKSRGLTTNETVIHAIEEHFQRSEANIRAMEQARLSAEPSHVKALEEFAQRAYRRPLSASERDGIGAFYRALRAEDGASHEDAVRDTLVSILMSPYFTYRVDLPVARGGGQPGRMQPLADYALASRLSYFLWASMPDAELLREAAAGNLHRRDTIVAQTRRMLRDERVRGFATEFAGNWLDFRRFEEHNAVDRGRFPSFDNDLREAMFEEPIRFFVEVAKENRSALDFLFGKYTVVNPVLANHYGIPGINGRSNDWVRVEDADRYHRGGLLPMSVFLTKNAPGLRTSPVKRGFWVVHRVLGEQIPPPPPLVPALPTDEAKLGELTLREALVRHRADKTCATCHARFDSFGVVFEGYGPIGEVRYRDLAGHPVDTRAEFPGGTEGAGLDGLREFLRGHRQDEFLDNLCRKLVSYALGRGLQLSDDSLIAEMRSRLAANGNRFVPMIETIVTSKQFLNQRVSVELAQH